MNNTVYYVWLMLALSPATSLPKKLLETFDNDIERLYDADVNEYLQVSGIGNVTAKKLGCKELSEAKRICELCAADKIEIITLADRRYPAKLAIVPNAPLLFYSRGKLPELNGNLCIAIVGTRHMTSYGRDMAYKLSYDLTKCGAIVISGMAEGVDGMAHNAALDAGGTTVGVLGCGVNVVYPSFHAGLMSRIIESGAVISEYLPNSRPERSNFPQRNRIISAISNGTLVIEAGKGSGSLITSNYAISQGRDLFAVPGKVGELNSLGTNGLIADGAKIVLSSLDILNEYKYLFPDKINIGRLPSAGFKHPEVSRMNRFDVNKNKTAASGNTHENAYIPQKPQAAPAAPVKLSETESDILAALRFDSPTSPDALMGGGLEAGTVMSSLISLEIKGLARRLDGGTYIRIK